MLTKSPAESDSKSMSHLLIITYTGNFKEMPYFFLPLSLHKHDSIVSFFDVTEGDFHFGE
jgi:hypothetical protein